MIIYIVSNMLENKILSGDFIDEKRVIPRIKFNSSLKDFLYIVIHL